MFRQSRKKYFNKQSKKVKNHDKQSSTRIPASSTLSQNTSSLSQSSAISFENPLHSQHNASFSTLQYFSTTQSTQSTSQTTPTLNTTSVTSSSHNIPSQSVSTRKFSSQQNPARNKSGKKKKEQHFEYKPHFSALPTVDQSITITPPKPSSSTHSQKWVYFQAGDICPPDARFKIFPFGLSIAIDKAEPYDTDHIKLSPDAIQHISQLDLGVRHMFNSFAKLGTKQVKGVRVTLFGSQTQIQNAPWECYRGLVSEQQRLRGSTLIKIPLSLAITDIDRPITEVLSPPIPVEGKLRDTFEEFVSAYTMPESGTTAQSLLHNSQDPSYHIHLLDNPDGNIQPGRIPKQFYPYLNIANALINDTPDPLLESSKPHLYFVRALYRPLLSPSIITKYSWPFGKTIYVIRNTAATEYLVEKIMHSPHLKPFCFVGDRVQDTLDDNFIDPEQSETVLDVADPVHRKFIRLNFGRRFLERQVAAHKAQSEIAREFTLREHIPDGVTPRDSLDIINKEWPIEIYSDDLVGKNVRHPDLPILRKLQAQVQKIDYNTKEHLKLISVPEQTALQLELDRSLHITPIDNDFHLKKISDSSPTPSRISPHKRTIVRSKSRTRAQIIQDNDLINGDVTDDVMSVQPKILLTAADGDQYSLKDQIFEIALDPLMLGMYHPQIPLHKIRNLLYKQIKRNQNAPNIASDYVHLLLHKLSSVPVCGLDDPMVLGIQRAQGLIQQSVAAVGLNSFTDRNSKFLKTHSLALTMSHIISRTLDFPSKYAQDYYEWKVYEQHQMDAVAVLRTASDVFNMAVEKHSQDLQDAVDEKRKKKENRIVAAFKRKVKRGDRRYHPDDIHRMREIYKNISDSEDDTKRHEKKERKKSYLTNGIPWDSEDDIDSDQELIVSTPSFAFLQLPSKLLHHDLSKNVNNLDIKDESSIKRNNKHEVIHPVDTNKLRPTTMLIPYLDLLNHPMNNNQHNVYVSFELVDTSVIGEENEVSKRRKQTEINNQFASGKEVGFDEEGNPIVNKEQAEADALDPDNYEIDPKTKKVRRKRVQDQAYNDTNNIDPSKSIETMVSQDDIDRVQRLIIAMQVEIDDLKTQKDDTQFFDALLGVERQLDIVPAIRRPTNADEKVTHLEKSIQTLEKAIMMINVPNKMLVANVIARRDIFPGEELLLGYHRLDDKDPSITSVSEAVPPQHHNEVLTMAQRGVLQQKQLAAERQRVKQRQKDEEQEGIHAIQERWDTEIMASLTKVQEIEKELTSQNDFYPKPLHSDDFTHTNDFDSQEKQNTMIRERIDRKRSELRLQLSFAKQDKDNLFDAMYSEIEAFEAESKQHKKVEELNKENFIWKQMTPQQLLMNYGIILPHLHLSPVALQHLDHEMMTAASTNVQNNTSWKTKTKDYTKIAQDKNSKIIQEAEDEFLRIQELTVQGKAIKAGQPIPLPPSSSSSSSTDTADFIMPGFESPTDLTDEMKMKTIQTEVSQTTSVSIRKQTIGEEHEDQVTEQRYNINPDIEPFNIVLDLEETSMRHLSRRATYVDFIPDVGVKERLGILRAGKEASEIESQILESTEMLEVIQRKIRSMDLLDPQMQRTKTLEEGNQDAENFSFEEHIAILRDRLELQGIIERLEMRKEELETTTKKGLLQTTLIELLWGNSTRALPPLFCSLEQINIFNNRYGYSTCFSQPLHRVNRNVPGAMDQTLSKPIRHVNTNLEDVLHYVLDDIFMVHNRIYGDDVLNLPNEPLALDDQESNKYINSIQQKEINPKSSQFLQDIFNIYDKETRGTLLACRFLYEIIATTFLEQCMFKEFNDTWESRERQKHTQVFDNTFQLPPSIAEHSEFYSLTNNITRQYQYKNKNSPTNKSFTGYIIDEDVTYPGLIARHAASMGYTESHNSNHFVDPNFDQRVKIMKEYMLTKIPHPLSLMEQCYRNIWLDNSLENTNKRKLKSKTTRNMDKTILQDFEQEVQTHKRGNIFQSNSNRRDKRLHQSSRPPNELSEIEDDALAYNPDVDDYYDNNDDDVDDEALDYEAYNNMERFDDFEDDDDDDQNNQMSDGKTKNAKKKFNAQKYINEINTLYENINYKVQPHTTHKDFKDFLHMSNACEVLGSYRKQQLDTMIYAYTHFYDKLERL